jgi:hypothetical protein
MIKILFQGTIYGPIESSSSIEIICHSLCISLKAKPVLVAVNDEKTIISNVKQTIIPGFYHLLADPTVPFHAEIEKVNTKIHDTLITPCHKTVETQTEKISSVQPAPTSSKKDIFPLQKDEMEECIDQMLHLISTIPPRYIKYNTVLSQQIDIALAQAQELVDSLNQMYQNINSDVCHPSGVDWNNYITFLQYRILNLLHDIWKRVWTRFSPSKRIFNVSKLYTLHSLQKVEHVLNCLSSWRRILEQKSWDKIKNYTLKEKSTIRKDAIVTEKDRLLQPPRLVSHEHMGAFVHVSQDCPSIKPLSKFDQFDLFRVEYLREISQKKCYKSKELLDILCGLLLQKEKEIKNFPSEFVASRIKSEFRLF